MPNCFSLTKKGENAPTPLVKIDEEICEHFQAEVHPTKYHASWFDIIGWHLAMGRDFPTIKEKLKSEFLLREDEGDKAFYSRQYEIADFLERHYVSDSWVQIGK